MRYECNESCVRKLKIYWMLYISRQSHSVTLFYETNIKNQDYWETLSKGTVQDGPFRGAVVKLYFI